MSRLQEYSRPIAGQAPCSYSQLGATYHGAAASLDPTQNGLYLVPDYCPSGPAQYPPAYDTLSHGGKNTCGGNFSFQNAYPLANCESCLGKAYAPYLNDGVPYGIPPTAFGQFSERQCASDYVPGCHKDSEMDKQKSRQSAQRDSFLNRLFGW